MGDQADDESRRPRAKDRPDIAIVLKRVGERVAAAREEQSLSQRELARRCGLTHRGLARVETAAGDASLGTFMVIAEQLGTNLEQLMAE